jgi:hypothetical protein
MRLNQTSNKALSVFIFVYKIKSTYLDIRKPLELSAKFGLKFAIWKSAAASAFDYFRHARN